jgi:hypothetical protein
MIEPQLSFENAILKVEWADQHIDELKARCDRFIQENAELALTKSQDDEGERHAFESAQEVPVEVALMLGDVVRNLRGALDYCWTGLARVHDPDIKIKETLPFNNDKKAVINFALKTPVGQAFPNAVRLVGDVICTHADFNNGGNRPLVILNRLANWEKHNLLVLTTRLIRTGTIEFGGVTIIGARIIGDISSMIKITGFGSNVPEVKSDGDASAEIIFGKHDFVKDEPIFPLVRNLAQATRQAVEAFIKTFPAEHPAA